jgi:hypothetical protein
MRAEPLRFKAQADRLMRKADALIAEAEALEVAEQSKKKQVWMLVGQVCFATVPLVRNQSFALLVDVSGWMRLLFQPG